MMHIKILYKPHLSEKKKRELSYPICVERSRNMLKWYRMNKTVQHSINKRLHSSKVLPTSGDIR